MNLSIIFPPFGVAKYSTLYTVGSRGLPEFHKRGRKRQAFSA